MVVRLSELLERIRPAGAPGAPTEGERLRDEALGARELAGIAAAVEAFENEADAIIDAARQRAEEQRRLADTRASQIRAGLPDRLATAEVSVIEAHQRRGEDESARLGAEAQREVARLHAASLERIPQLVSAALDAIWASLPAPQPERTTDSA